jgi:exodeoxyribonuclease VII large subunit
MKSTFITISGETPEPQNHILFFIPSMRLSFDPTSAAQITADAISVSQLNNQIKQILENAPLLRQVSVRGEISNFRRQHGSGHCYFSLKDETAQIRCCLWKFQVPRVKFLPADCDRVIVRGKVDFYARGGEISFIVDAVEFAGQGALWEAFARLKEKLAKEGLFDPERKKPLPPFPRRIGVITSASGAVWHDIIHILERRWPMITAVRIPAVVQGSEAPRSLQRALNAARNLPDLDVLIIARGGGSAEDLWCFNDEALARQVADFPLPVISAVGHETDFTILDFVADHRAPTPSAAAEMATPDRIEISQHLSGLRARLTRQSTTHLARAREELERLQQRAKLAHPAARIHREREKLERLNAMLKSTFEHRIKSELQQLANLRGRLTALNPTRVLERGYALVRDQNGQLITSAASGAQQKVLSVIFHDGEIHAEVKE